ncbi:MAG: YkgJ family cysteine cluster protein [Candidatus Omnitrophica bacterium]|nr:YkgJ family cysteine cluster protein [Candidatus Omnitrophota bacterium]
MHSLFHDMPQFVPQDFCLECEGCCRFQAQDHDWRPKVAENNLSPLNKDVKSSYYQSIDPDGRIKTKEISYMAYCQFLDSLFNKCMVYTERPFECRLYPFLVERKGKKVFISVHLACPYIQEKRYTKDFDVYKNALEKYFEKHHALEFFKKNSYLIEDYTAYQDEIEEMFVLGAA